MGQYITTGTKKQEGTSGKANKKQQKATGYNWRQRRDSDSQALRAARGLEHPLEPVAPGLFMDPRTGEVRPELNDPKYPHWQRKKQKTLGTADLYRLVGYDSHADRLVSCATWMQYFADLAGDKRTLRAFNACHLRMCPLCANRRARQMSSRLVRILNISQDVHPGSKILFLTLTVKNVPGAALRDTLAQLTKSWDKLAKRRPFRKAIKGWFRAIEITYNPVTGEYHPHIHAILVVEAAYFQEVTVEDDDGNKEQTLYANGLYIPHGRDDVKPDGTPKTPDWYTGPFWVEMWQQCLKVDYQPSVRISRVEGRTGEQRDTDAASYNAALEAAKYATKDSEYLNGKTPEAERAGVLRTYTDALHRKRLVALGGWLADAAAGLDLEDDGDLVHDDESSGDDLTAATAEMLESYGWHFGVARHVLTDRMPNPDYQGPGGQHG